MDVGRRHFLQMAALGLAGAAGAFLTPAGFAAGATQGGNLSDQDSVDVITGALESFGDGWLEIVQNKQGRRLTWNDATTFWKTRP